MNLEEIYKDYQSLGLGGKDGVSNKFIPGIGPCPADLMIVGEAPGATEDEVGKPFQGVAGRALDSLLGFSGFNRKEVFTTNVFKYRPPNNRDPYSHELIASYPTLSAEIKCVDPKVIILAGRIAAQSVFRTEKLKSLRGRPIKKNDRIIICTYHPVILRRRNRPGMGNLIKKDFLLAAKLVKGSE